MSSQSLRASAPYAKLVSLTTPVLAERQMTRFETELPNVSQALSNMHVRFSLQRSGPDNVLRLSLADRVA